MLKPAGLTHGHYECRNFGETIPILTDLLALKVVEKREPEMTLKHPNTDWRLVVHEGGPTAREKPLMNHYGVRVADRQQVNAAWEYITAQKARFGVEGITKPKGLHFAYSFYFKEPGGNYLEIESYDPAAAAEGRSTAAPHWSTPLTEDQFPGKPYLPQALSHGTLECDEKEASERFYRNVLGLEIAGGGRLSLYIKHSSTPWYIVVLPGRKRTDLSPSSRFTLTLASREAVEGAHREFTASGHTLGVTEVRAIQRQGQEVSFIFSDLDRNWWELSAPGTP